VIQCLTCGTENLPGAIFCSACGSELLESAQPGQLRLLLIETGQNILLSGKDVFTLGRWDSGESIMPDIDLSPFQAYELGVSRMHLTIERCADEYNAVDLGSSNGSWLNSVKMDPQKAYLLKTNDILTLGLLKLQVQI
jgi:pSer/pThr/pTyr-binding forkhead associated (FHA) protein